jgi:signal transduction histidine kinase
VLHELRNPLSAVLSAIEVLMDERREDETLRSELEIIENEVRRALLGLEGLGLGTRQLRSASAESVGAAIRAVCQVLGPRAKRNRIELDVNIDELPPLYLDPGALRAVVYNLVTNAMHACRQGATVRIVARMDQATGDFELSVEDTGTGMTPEVLARCTELFFTTKRSGSGIGLALCRDLVSRGGGEIEILSALGVGTKVRITVPVAEMRPLQSGI